MHYVLIYDVVDGFIEKRQPYRPEHLEHVSKAYQDSAMIMGGALADPPDKVMMVFKCPEADVVEEFAKTDPYVTNGLVKEWRVRRWNTVSSSGTPV